MNRSLRVTSSVVLQLIYYDIMPAFPFPVPAILRPLEVTATQNILEVDIAASAL